MRTIKGAARNQAKRRLFKRAKGYRGGRGKLLRTVKESLIRAGAYAYRDRRKKKSEFRALWITRINAAARGQGMTYSRFMSAVTSRIAVSADAVTAHTALKAREIRSNWSVFMSVG
jgi:ribosomal protein L20